MYIYIYVCTYIYCDYFQDVSLPTAQDAGIGSRIIGLSRINGWMENNINQQILTIHYRLTFYAQHYL